MTVELKANAQESLNFLKFIYPLGPWTITSITENLDEKATNPVIIRARTFYSRQANDLLHHLDEHNGKSNLYWQINPLLRNPTTKANLHDVKEVPRLHVDLDPRKGTHNREADRKLIRALLEDENRLKAHGLPGGPSLIVDSGNGYWAFWNLEQSLTVDGETVQEIRENAAEIGRYNRWIAEVLNSALHPKAGLEKEIGDTCHNIDRIARLPGTINLPDHNKLKAGYEPVIANIYTNYPERLYTIDQFNKSDVVSWGAKANQEDFKRIEVGTIVRMLPESKDPYEIAQELKRLYPQIGERTLELITLGEYVEEGIGDDNINDKIDANKKLSVNRSKAHWRVNRSLQQHGIPLNVILGLLCDERLPISAHAREPINDRTGHIGAKRSGRELIHFNETQIRKCAISIENQRKEDEVLTQEAPGASSTKSPEAETPKNKEPRTINEVVKHLNNKHAVLEHEGGRCCVLSWEISEFGNREIPILQTVPDFTNRYVHKRIDLPTSNGKMQEKNWADVWFHNARRKQYLALRFLPGQPKEVDGYLNLWRGWSLEPKPGDWSLMKDHIFNVLASGNQEYADYIIKWAAWAVQNPHRPAEAALVFRGGKGVGKGIFGRAMQNLFGAHGLQVTHENHITGRFNGHLRTCCLLFADEAIAAGDKQAENVLKGLITEPQVQIERKRIDMTAARNYLHIIMASNEEWVVPASGLERRFAVFDVSEIHQQDSNYFDPLYDQIENEDDRSGLAAMLYDLLNMDIGYWHPRHNIPQTEALRQQKEISLNGFDQFLLNMLEEGMLLGMSAGSATNTVYSNSYKQELGIYDHIRLSSPKFRNASYRAMAKQLKENWGCEHYRGTYGRGWTFPPLKEMRAIWDKKYWKHNWPDNHENWNVINDEDVPF